MESNYIAHHGIKGQKWGVEHGPPYPVRRGSGGKPKTTNIVKSKLRSVIDNRNKKREAKKAEQERRVAEIKERRAQKAAEKHVDDYEKLKQQVVKHPKDLYKNKNRFSKKEIEELIKEIEFDRKIKDVKNQEIDRGLKEYERIKNALALTSQSATSLKTLYNIAAEINNVLVDSGKSNGSRWVKLGDAPPKDDKDKK